MIKKLCYACVLLCGVAGAQGVRYDIPPILGPTGQPLPNIAVTLCAGTGTISGTTCSPQTQSFSDITLGVPCAVGNPVTLTASTQCQNTSDAFGNAGFWLSPGAYIFCLTGRGIAGACYNLTVPAGSTPSGTLRSGPITASGQVTVPDGSVSAPGIRFTSNNSGLFNIGGSTIVSVNGNQGPFFNNNVNLSSNSSCYTFGGSQDTSIGRGAAGQVTVGSGTCGDASGSLSLAGNNRLQQDTGRFGAGALRLQNIGTNAPAVFTLMPSGTDNESDLRLYNSSDPANTGIFEFDLVGNVLGLSPNSFGTGTTPNALRINGATTLQFTSDTGLSRSAAGTLAIGNGTQGDFTGTLTLQNLNFPALGTANGSGPTNFGSGTITLGTSGWNGSSAVSMPVTINYSPAFGFANPNVFLSANFSANLLQNSFVQLQNTKAATSGANVSSPVLEFIGQSWNGSASQQDYWMIQNVPGAGSNPLNTLTLTHGGGSGPSAVQVSNGVLQVGQADTGVSRSAAGTVAVGNGTQGDKSGTIAAAKLTDDGSGNFYLIQNSTQALNTYNGGVFAWSSTGLANGSKDTGLSRPTAGTVAVGNGTPSDASGTLKATTVNAVSGFQVNGTALAASNLSNGVTGSGAVVLANNPSLATPNIGTASGNTLTFANQAAPTNPPSGSITIYGDSGTGFLTCRNSSGGSCLSSTASAPFISNTANPATTGVLRAASGDTAVAFRNNANSGDVAALAKDTSDVVQVGGSAGMKSNTLQATSNSGLPASCGGAAFFVNDVTSPNSADICFGDGTGWFFNLTKRTGSTSTSVFSVKDTGVVNATSGYQVNGSALSASNLSNGVTGSGSVVLATSPTLGGTATVNAIQTNAANPATSGVYRCTGNQACAVARTPDNTNDVQLGYALNGPRAVFGSIGGSTVGVTAQLGELQVDTGVTVNGAGFKHFRTSGTSCTTSGAGAGVTCQTAAISFPGPAFADTNYTGVCATEGPNTGTPVIMGLGTKSTTSFTLVVGEMGTAASAYGTADCIFVHD